MTNAGDGMRSRSLWSHHYRERHFDEFLIPIDGVQGAADVIGDVGAAVVFDPIGQFHDGGFQGELVFVDFEKQGREQV